MNSPPPSVYKHPSFSPQASARSSQSLETSKNLSLLLKRRTHDFCMNSLKSRTTYILPNSEGGSCGPYRSARIFWSLRVVGLILLCLTIFVCLLLMYRSHNCSTESSWSVVLVILLSNVVMRVGRISMLSRFGSKLLSLLSFLESEKKHLSELYCSSSIVMSMPLVSFDTSITLAFDACPRRWCHCFIWGFLLSR